MPRRISKKGAFLKKRDFSPSHSEKTRNSFFGANGLFPPNSKWTPLFSRMGPEKKRSFKHNLPSPPRALGSLKFTLVLANDFVCLFFKGWGWVSLQNLPLFFNTWSGFFCWMVSLSLRMWRGLMRQQKKKIAQSQKNHTRKKKKQKYLRVWRRRRNAHFNFSRLRLHTGEEGAQLSQHFHRTEIRKRWILFFPWPRMEFRQKMVINFCLAREKSHPQQ